MPSEAEVLDVQAALAAGRGPRAAPLDRRAGHGARASRSTAGPRSVALAAAARRARPSGPSSPAGSSTRWRRSPGIERVDVDLRVMTDEEIVAPGAACSRASPRQPAAGARRRRRPAAPARGTPSPTPAPGCSRSRRARAGSASRRSPPTSRSRSRERGRQVAAIDADVWGFSMPRMLGIDRAARAHRRRHRPARGQRRDASSRWASSPARTRPSSGAARCCTRRSSSSSPTCTGASPTTSSSTCRRAPATSRCRWRSSSRAPRCSSSPRRSPPRRRSRSAPAAMAREGRPRRSIGVIENMSWFTGDDGTRYELFGERRRPGARRPSSRCRCSAQIPLVPELRDRRRRRPARSSRSIPTVRSAQVFRGAGRAPRRRAGAEADLQPGAQAQLSSASNSRRTASSAR